MPPSTAPSRRPAFTLVELLVVIAIIGVLIGALLPALGGARSQAMAMRDMSAVRQLVLAYELYAAEHDDQLIVGFYSADPGGRVFDHRGARVDRAQARQRYTWRLFSYMDDVPLQGSLLSGAQESLLGDVPEPGTPERSTWQYIVSVYPSFGVNGHFLGGYKVDPELPAGARRAVASAPDFSVARRLSEIARPGEMIAFGSTRGEHYQNGAPVFVEGWYLIESPQWGDAGPFGGGTPQPWADAPYDREKHPEHYGNIDGRYDSGRVLIGVIDGHVEMIAPSELRDMTMWSNDAARRDDPEWSPLGAD